jgi:Flp pilus assembly protein TadG
MAMVLPILLMLSFGIVDYGYYFFLKSTVQAAAQAGARAAIVPGATSANVTSAVSAIMTPAGLSSTSYSLTTNPTDMSTAASGANITVTISCTWGTVGYHTLSTTMGGIASTKQMSTTITMRKE